MASVYRVSIAEVHKIFDTDMDSDKIQACIRTANWLVSAVIEPEGSMDSEGLRNVELWLAAHFACIQDPIALRAKIGDAEVWSFAASVTTAWGKGLNQTVYGQNAIAMDTTGSLLDLGKQKASYRAGPRENSKRFTRGLT